ncbi:MAG TPA: group 1 truncated hemoglobin [Ignavibacteriaceae bacterium]|nr:group 1 truncated hemoglobin [Ignavibacteriaceae bacterium]
MKIAGSSVSGKILLTILLFIITSSSQSVAQEKTLYQRLGGYDAIAAVVDDFVMQLATDASIGAFFKGHSEDSIKKIRQHVVDFICNAAGGPCNYTGRDMKTSHKGMGITEAQWNKSVEYLKNTLNKFKVPEKEQNELFAAVSSVKRDIVEM